MLNGSWNVIIPNDIYSAWMEYGAMLVISILINKETAESLTLLLDQDTDNLKYTSIKEIIESHKCR